MTSRGRAVGLIALAMVMALVGSSQAAEIAPVKIFGGRTDQILPGANATWIGWSHNTVSSPDHYDAYARPVGPTGPVEKLNTGTSNGFFGDIRPDANEVIIQKVNRRFTKSDIWLADLDSSHTLTDPGTGINTDGWEFDPKLSKDWILFARYTRRKTSIYLFDRTTTLISKLATASNSSHGQPRIFTNDVTETYATWERWHSSSADIYYYDLSTKITAAVPNPTSRFFYTSSVSDATGDLYFARDNNACGGKAKILRWHIGDPLPYTTVASLPAGYDVTDNTQTFNDGTHDNVYFDEEKCSGNHYSNIYELPAADTAS